MSSHVNVTRAGMTWRLCPAGAFSGAPASGLSMQLPSDQTSYLVSQGLPLKVNVLGAKMDTSWPFLEVTQCSFCQTPVVEGVTSPLRFKGR